MLQIKRHLRVAFDLQRLKARAVPRAPPAG
jgi:hypothetical protein